MSAISWGVGDFCGGLGSRRWGALGTLAAAQLIGLAAVLLAAQVAGGAAPLAGALLWAAAAGLGGTLGLGAFFVALSRSPMSLVAPIVGVLAAGIPAVVGIALGDALPVHRAVGIGLAVAAVALVSLSGSDSSRAAVRLDAAGVALSIGAGIGFAAFYLLIARASADGANASVLWLLLPARAIGAAMLVAAVLLRRPPLPVLSASTLPILLLAGFGDVGGNLFFVLAQEAVPLSVAAVLSSMYPVVTVILAASLLRERLGGMQLVGVLLAAAAIALIAV